LDDERFRTGITSTLHDIPSSAPPDLEPVRRRARRLRAKRGLTATVVAAVVAAGVAVPLTLLSSLRHPVTPRILGQASGGEGLPQVARIVCDGITTTVLTPEIRPQPDGVGFEVDNRSNAVLSFEIENFGGGNAPVGVRTINPPDTEGADWAVPPGAVHVRCLASSQDVGSDQGWQALTISDPQKIYLPASVECAPGDGATIGIMDHVSDATGQQGDPVDLTRTLLAAQLRSGDNVEHAGYPDTVNAKVRVVRDGKVIAVVRWTAAQDGGWLPDETQECGSFAPGGAPPNLHVPPTSGSVGGRSGSG